MTIPFGCLLLRRNASGAWCFTRDPSEIPNQEDDWFDPVPRYCGGERLVLVDSNGDELAASISLFDHLPGFESHAEFSTAGYFWEGYDHKFFYRDQQRKRLYGVIYPSWVVETPLVVDLVDLRPARPGSFDMASIQKHYHDQIRAGVLGLLAKLKAQESLVYADIYCHHAGLLQMTDLEESLRKLKMRRNKWGFPKCKGALKALHALGFNDEAELVEAASHGNVNRVKELIPICDVNWQTEDGKTALHCAVEHSHIETVMTLLQVNGINTRVQDQYRRTPLFGAKNRMVLKLLLDNNLCCLSRTDKNSQTAFHVFCAANNKECVAEILSRGQDPDNCGTEYTRKTCLYEASEAGHSDMVLTLLKAGANVNKTAREVGPTVLYGAVKAGNIEIVKILLAQEGINVNLAPKASYSKNAESLLPLRVASQQGNPDIARLLLDHPGISSVSIEAALVTSIESGNKSTMVSMLLKHDLVNTECIKSALTVAGRTGNEDIIQILLQHNQMDLATCIAPALTAASMENHITAVALLINEIDIRAWPARRFLVYHAAKMLRLELLKLLLQRGIETGYQDKDGCTALHLVVGKNCTEAIRLILEHGGDTNIRDNLGWSAFHHASGKSDTSLVAMLLEHGADPGLKTEKGETPLDIARAAKHLNVIRILVLRLTREL